MPGPTPRDAADAAPSPTSLTDYRARTGRPAPVPPRATPTPPAPDTTRLLSHFGHAAVSAGTSQPYHRIVASVLARAHRVTAAGGPEWSRFLGVLDRQRVHPQATVSCGVLSNLVGIAAFGDAIDFATLAELADRLGADRLAAIQHRTARFVEPDPTFPITTVAIDRMVTASAHPVSRGSLDSAATLLITGVDPDEFLPLIRTAAELRGVLDAGSVLEWRHHLAAIAANPWSPYSRHLVDLAALIERPHAARVVDRVTEILREQHKQREREQVAEEVRRLVSDSGVSQRQFAQWVGTSPSRLCTYVSGAVIPSASLMLRMARTSRLLQERDVPPTPSAGSQQSWGAARASADGGSDGPGDPPERDSGAFGRRRSHLSAV